ncbi:hypothetical protein IKU74_00030 [bacterium]|nr:hypothetical protein [bacterium]
MSTIGFRAAKMLGVKPKELVNIMNNQAIRRGHSTPWLKPNGALTDVGKGIYQNEKNSFGAKNLKEYLSAIANYSKTHKLDEPFNKLLDVNI